MTAQTDLLGRVTSYTDALSTVTTTLYNSATGTVTSVSTDQAGSPLASLEEFTYELDGQLNTVTIDGTQVADTSYDAHKQLASVAYGNGSSLGSITRDTATNATLAMQWAFPSSQTSITDAVVRSQSGRVLKDTLTDGTAASSTYSCDAAGRLTQAVIPGHTLGYLYDGSGGCGVDAAAGNNGNRTSSTDLVGTTTTTVTYCYDNADRLTSTTTTGAGTGLDPVSSGLTTTGPGATLAYDGHGNTTTLADQTSAMTRPTGT